MNAKPDGKRGGRTESHDQGPEIPFTPSSAAAKFLRERSKATNQRQPTHEQLEAVEQGDSLASFYDAPESAGSAAYRAVKGIPHPVARLSLPTRALQVGDVVLAHGLRCEIVGAPVHSPDHAGVYFVEALVLSREPGCPVPECWTGQPGSDRHSWVLQGNDLALWCVERSGGAPDPNEDGPADSNGYDDADDPEVDLLGEPYDAPSQERS